ncbi:hypothetical protein K437DRAFT_257786 [Tilletiaria anomala UBC 951]|uniref:Amino acid transporter transmembrane domain-containing protein n=1 Tax=Tilletiaria anomala (strain ATCC 24038 / CBS 436.72 / UBC 951) TaxID=1037660 RepID=A0A066VQP7_TILAU|nr:uncharacterized protein K437DRAFT_257786 [Tilletiaria anomala UBC 951]KDN42603.1 hypothetical protein K437DRAFT_257786 [Tilletiaria anomala UBC 951]
MPTPANAASPDQGPVRATTPVQAVVGNVAGPGTGTSLEEIRAQYQELGVSPQLPNIPVRSNAHSPAIAPASSDQRPLHDSGFNVNLAAPIDQLELPGPVARAIAQEGGASKASASGTGTPLTQTSALPSNGDASDADSSMLDMDTLPMTDAQKARIVQRHLAITPTATISASDTPADGTASERSSAAFDDVTTSAGDQHPRDRSYFSQVGGDRSHVHFGDGAASGNESDLSSGVEGYQGPHSMQGGAITDDIYRWAHANRPQKYKRARSESLHLPRTSTIDPTLDTAGIKEPGGFRRYFVHAQATEQGRPKPRALRSFIDFLSLYGHFAGEDLDELDEDEYDEEEGEDGEDLERTIPGSSREAGRGTTEGAPLLAARSRSGRGRGRRMERNSIEQRIRDPSANKTPGEATVTEAVLMLLKSFVGTGILFLGKAFFNGGLFFSIIVLTAIAMISLVSFLLLVKANLKVPASFGEMGGVLYGPYMRLAILASIVLSQLGFVAAYTVFVAQNLQAFILAVTHCQTKVPIVYLIIAELLAFLPLSLVRRIAKLSSTALIADVFILFGIVYLFQHEIGLLATRGLADVKMFNSHDFPLLIGTAVFTFEGIGLVIPITESMKEPERFPGVLSGVMVGITFLFGAAGALGYAAFGSKVQTVVITNLPQERKFVQAMQFLYSLAILLSTPLQLFPALSILERGVFTTKSGKYDWRVKTQKNVFRCLVVVASALVAWAGASDLDKFVSLIGSTACVPLCFIYPPLLHLKACATKVRTKVLDYMLLMFGVVCVLFAGSQTIVAMAAPGSPPDQTTCTLPPPGF